jgi:hypothetical protein
MISCYPSVTRGQCPITQTPALQGFVASEHVSTKQVLGRVVLNHRMIKHDVRTLHAGEYSASMQGQGNPHPHSIVKVPIKEREVARPTVIRPPVVLSVYDPPPKNPSNPFSWSAKNNGPLPLTETSDLGRRDGANTKALRAAATRSS